MCNQHKLKASLIEIADMFGSRLATPLALPEGAPNLEPRDAIRITDIAPIVRPGQGAGGGAELVQRRWSWPGPTGAPVFNFRAEGRRFPLPARCAIPTEGFYEFTANADPLKSGPKVKRKDRWLFTMPGEPLFFIAGVLRGDAWSMLTVDPGPDVAPFHNRQVVTFHPEAALAWLQGAPEAELLLPSPEGTLAAARG